MTETVFVFLHSHRQTVSKHIDGFAFAAIREPGFIFHLVPPHLHLEHLPQPSVSIS